MYYVYKCICITIRKTLFHILLFVRFCVIAEILDTNKIGRSSQKIIWNKLRFATLFRYTFCISRKS